MSQHTGELLAYIILALGMIVIPIVMAMRHEHRKALNASISRHSAGAQSPRDGVRGSRRNKNER